MQTPTRNDPPSVPLRHGGWPIRKTPRWLFAAGAIVLAGVVAVGLVHHPSRSERAADMNAFLHDMTTDIQSCAGGVGESLLVLRQTESGASHDAQTAIKDVKNIINGGTK